MSKRNELDLSDLLDEPEGSNVISLDDLIPEPRKAREPVEVVLFWTLYTCECGRNYEYPTYGTTLTKYAHYRYGKLKAYVYEPYLPACHADLPRSVEPRHIYIPHCPTCLHEHHLELDRQLDLFGEIA